MTKSTDDHKKSQHYDNVVPHTVVIGDQAIAVPDAVDMDDAIKKAKVIVRKQSSGSKDEK